MGQGLRIGTLGGAPIRLSSSLLLLAVLLGVLYAPSAAELGAFGPAAWLLPVGYVLILVVSVLVHELAHACVGLATGNRPTEIVVNIWGGHTQFGQAGESPGRTALIAAVGPFANLVLAGVAWLVLLTLPTSPSIGAQLAVGAMVMNLILGLFNLVPGLPMDGGQVLESAVWGATGRRSSGTVAAAWAGRAMAVAVVGWALLQYVNGSRSVILLLWTAMIALVIWQGASASLRFAGVRRRAEQVDLRRLVVPAIAVPAGTSAQDLLAAVAAHAELDPHCVVVMSPAGPVGIVQPAAVMAVPPQQRAVVTAEQVADPHDPQDVVDVGVPSAQLLTRLRAISSNALVVTDGGRLVGVVPGKALMEALLPRR